MIPQFFGTVNMQDADSPLVHSAAHSNNFHVELPEPGHARIVFDEWIAYAPCVTVTCAPTGAAEHPWASCAASRKATDEPYVVDIYVNAFEPGGTTPRGVNAAFSFTALCGTNLDLMLAKGENIRLSADIFSFGASGGHERSVLRLSLDRGDGTTAFLDKGTCVRAYTDSDTREVLLELSHIMATGPGSQAYTLQGYTYSLTAQPVPEPWQQGEIVTSQHYAIALPAGPSSSPLEKFSVVATPAAGALSILSSDPVVDIRDRGTANPRPRPPRP